MWIIVSIASYFLFAIVVLIDKYLLSGPLPSPKTYVFYIGVMGGGVVVVLSALGFVVIPEISILLLGLVAGVMRTLFLLALFHALRLFEASRIIPALGGALPVFTFLFTFLWTGDREVLLPTHFLAFVFLVAGTVGISLVKDHRMTAQSIVLACLAGFLGASSFFFSKFVYDAQPFLSGFSWVLLGAFIMSLAFLGAQEVREQVSKLFSRRKTKLSSLRGNTLSMFLGNQVAGGSAVLLQNFAIALAPLGFLPFVSALAGVEYLFLLAFGILFASRFPAIRGEKISPRTLIEKTIAILLIGAGLILLAL